MSAEFNVGRKNMNSLYVDRNWEDLEHAFGSAEDVPNLLIELNSSDTTTRNNALHELFGNIWHQGTVYPATVKAIPALVALLQSPSCHDSQNVALLLACIANGDGYYNVHSNLEKLRPTYEKILAEKGTSITEEIQRENIYVEAIQSMAVEYMPLVESYLKSEDSGVREAVISAMFRHAKTFNHYEQTLAEHLDVEIDEDIRDLILSELKLLHVK